MKYLAFNAYVKNRLVYLNETKRSQLLVMRLLFLDDTYFLFKIQQLLYACRFYSICLAKRRCIASNFSRASKRFQLSRISFRELCSYGNVVGLRKSS